MRHDIIVLRPFPGPEGAMLRIGTRHDATRWKNREALIDQKYVRIAKRAKAKPEEPFVPPKKKLKKTGVRKPVLAE